ncbi:MAG: preprotein translocase subunit SecE [Sedimentisphaerales bacterium]|nr:preprotein translocase subunit SecE [Sedimentisphaerales bacterium]
MILSIYKRGQGRYTRLCSAGAGGLLIAIGCMRLYQVFDATDINLWITTMVPAGILLAAAVMLLWLVNKPNIADFMIASEGEMKKVNWSSRQEIAVSTFIVIVVVVILAVILGAADFIFQLAITWLVL